MSHQNTALVLSLLLHALVLSCALVFAGNVVQVQPPVRIELAIGTATSLSSNSIVFTREAPLLPKLRGQLAEFLNESYPAHLSLFSQPTCVGFGYGRKKASLAAFPGSRASMASVPLRNLPVRSRLSSAVFPAKHAYSLGPGLPSPGST